MVKSKLAVVDVAKGKPKALLIWLWPIKPSLSHLTLPLEATDYQKAGRKEVTALPNTLTSWNSQGTAFCWLCRQEGESEL